jgi:hypothetical protein
MPRGHKKKIKKNKNKNIDIVKVIMSLQEIAKV